MGLVTFSERSSLDMDRLTATLSSSKCSNQGVKGRGEELQISLQFRYCIVVADAYFIQGLWEVKDHTKTPHSN